MELRQLRYFVAAAEELHIGRAAARMYITQPAFSQQIRRLERELGVSLLEVDNHKVGLTAAGRAFLSLARRTLEQADDAAESARRAARGELGSLAIGYAASVGPGVLAPLLRRLRDEVPDVAPNLYEMWTARQLDALRQRRIHLGVVIGGVSDPALSSRVLQREPFVALLPESHPLAAHPEVPFAALAELPLVLFRRELNPRLHDRLVAIGRAAGVRLNIRYEVSDVGAIPLLVASGHAVALSSASRADQFGHIDLARRAIVTPTPMEEIRLVWRADEVSRVVLNFLEIVATLPVVNR